MKLYIAGIWTHEGHSYVPTEYVKQLRKQIPCYSWLVRLQPVDIVKGEVQVMMGLTFGRTKLGVSVMTKQRFGALGSMLYMNK